LSISVLILAGGASTRMGSPKALLPDPDGRPFVARVARTFASAGLDHLVVVTGYQHEEIANALAADAPPVLPACVRNPDPARGQLSSLWVGLEAAMHPEVEAVLMTLVDVPMVLPSTVRAVVEAWERTRAPIVRPAVGNRHGHPVLFDRAVFEDLKRAPLTEGAKAVIHAYGDRVVNVAVDDPGSLMDVDTPADYEQLRRGL
jgi:CTP:molybdopterin cytidylyltransferase MocA